MKRGWIALSLLALVPLAALAEEPPPPRLWTSIQGLDEDRQALLEGLRDTGLDPDGAPEEALADIVISGTVDPSEPTRQRYLVVARVRRTGENAAVLQGRTPSPGLGLIGRQLGEAIWSEWRRQAANGVAFSISADEISYKEAGALVKALKKTRGVSYAHLDRLADGSAKIDLRVPPPGSPHQVARMLDGSALEISSRPVRVKVTQVSDDSVRVKLVDPAAYAADAGVPLAPEPKP